MPVKNFRAVWFVCLFFLWFQDLALGQSSSQAAFEQGYQSYMRNQFPIAETHFRKALQTAPTGEDKAFILKFLGISQYMRGDKKSATLSFREAVTLNPKTAIFQGEVLDSTVIPFFNNVKKSTLASVKAVKKKPKISKKSKSKVASEKKKKKKRRKKKRKTNDDDIQISFDPVEEKKPVAKKSGFRPLHLLPFGIGHFADSNYFWGSAYGVVQAVSLLTYFNKNTEIAAEEKENEEIQARDDLTDDNKREFIQQNNKFLTALDEDAQLSISLFGLTYLISLIHGMSVDPPQASALHDKDAGSILARLPDANRENPYRPQIDFHRHKNNHVISATWELR